MKRTVAVLVLLVSAARPLAAEEPPVASLLVEQSQGAFYTPERDMRAKVTMELIAEDGKKRTRVLTMLRQNVASGKDQKYFLYFHEPGDVRRMAFLVWKYPERDDDRWIFIPSVNMVRRVAASDSRSSFVGSDFTYEDVSGRDVSADAHVLLREETLGDARCYVVQSVPHSPAEYTKKLAWIDKRTSLPRREEYYDAQDELARVFSADMIEDVAVGTAETKKLVPTITKRTMTNVKSGHRTEVRFEDVAYNVGLEDAVFAERAMRNPPRKWIE